MPKKCSNSNRGPDPGPFSGPELADADLYQKTLKLSSPNMGRRAAGAVGDTAVWGFDLYNLFFGN